MVCFLRWGQDKLAWGWKRHSSWPFCSQTHSRSPLRVKLLPFLGFFLAVPPAPQPEGLPLWVSGNSPCHLHEALLALSSGPICSVGRLTVPFAFSKREACTELIQSGGTGSLQLRVV